MQRVLLTGATGFIGRHCLPRLAGRGLEVHAVSSRASRKRGEAIWHRADLLDAASIERLVAEVKPSRVLHLAWHGRGGDLYGSPRNLLWAEAGLALVRAAASAGVERLVAAGSCAEYDWSHALLSETTTPLEPRSLYGAAKLGLSILVDAWGRTGDLSTAWPRIFFLYGPGEDRRRLVPSVATSLLTGDTARCTHGRQVRDYLYVEDAAEALVALLESGLTGPVNLASGEPLALRDLILETARQLGAEERVELGALQAPEDDPPRLVADVRRLRRELGWAPRTSLADGVARTVAWWRAETVAR